MSAGGGKVVSSAKIHVAFRMLYLSRKNERAQRNVRRYTGLRSQVIYSKNLGLTQESLRMVTARGRFHSGYLRRRSGR